MKIAQFNRFEIILPDEAVDECYHQGLCDEDVTRWEPKIKIEASPAAIRAELKEYGAWDSEELKDDVANRRRIIWLAAADIQEEQYQIDYATT